MLLQWFQTTLVNFHSKIPRREAPSRIIDILLPQPPVVAPIVTGQHQMLELRPYFNDAAGVVDEIDQKTLLNRLRRQEQI